MMFGKDLHISDELTLGKVKNEKYDYSTLGNQDGIQVYSEINSTTPISLKDELPENNNHLDQFVTNSNDSNIDLTSLDKHYSPSDQSDLTSNVCKTPAPSKSPCDTQSGVSSPTTTSSNVPPLLNDNEKPPYSYVALISMAIQSKPQKKATLNEIYNYITANYKYFEKKEKKGWQNSIRHNLSLNDCFIKQPKDGGGEKKGSYWALAVPLEKLFENNNLKRRKRMRRHCKTSPTAYTSSFYGDPYSLSFRHRNVYNAAARYSYNCPPTAWNLQSSISSPQIPGYSNCQVRSPSINAYSQLPSQLSTTFQPVQSMQISSMNSYNQLANSMNDYNQLSTSVNGFTLGSGSPSSVGVNPFTSGLSSCSRRHDATDMRYSSYSWDAVIPTSIKEETTFSPSLNSPTFDFTLGTSRKGLV